MVKVTKEQFDVPASIMLKVSDLICGNQLTHEIIEVDEDADTITLELEYTKQERDVIHQIEDLIADNSDDEEEEEDEDDDE
jgi:hypothetical protein